MRPLASSYVFSDFAGVPHRRVTEAGSGGSFPPHLALHCVCVCSDWTLLSVPQLSLSGQSGTAWIYILDCCIDMRLAWVDSDPPDPGSDIQYGSRHLGVRYSGSPSLRPRVGVKIRTGAQLQI